MNCTKVVEVTELVRSFHNKLFQNKCAPHHHKMHIQKKKKKKKKKKGKKKKLPMTATCLQ